MHADPECGDVGGDTELEEMGIGSCVARGVGPSEDESMDVKVEERESVDAGDENRLGETEPWPPMTLALSDERSEFGGDGGALEGELTMAREAGVGVERDECGE